MQTAYFRKRKYLLSQIEIQAKLIFEPIKFIMHSSAHLANFSCFSVIQLAVVEYKLNIADELLNLNILVLSQLSSNSAEIHGILHNLIIVLNI